jgi:hypothetical protein
MTNQPVNKSILNQKVSNSRNLSKSYLERAVFEFTSTVDNDADSWLLYILEGYMSGDAIKHTDASMRADMMRNFNRIVEFVRTIQKGYENGEIEC